VIHSFSFKNKNVSFLQILFDINLEYEGKANSLLLLENTLPGDGERNYIAKTAGSEQLFPVATVTNHYKLNGLKQHNMINSQLWVSEMQHSLIGLKPKCQQACIASGSSGEICFLVFSNF
jgi:hypothetical protein